MSNSLENNVALAIGQQVEHMIFQAKQESEARVRHELHSAYGQLQRMESVIGDLTARVRARGSRASADSSQSVDVVFVTQRLQQMETKWASEVKALKQDLHRTILAHNHNSDLMRHHRDALDEARAKLDARTWPKAEQVDMQIEQVDRLLRTGQAKQRALDTLTERLANMEAQAGDALHVASASVASGLPSAPPGVPPPGVAAPSVAPGLGTSPYPEPAGLGLLSPEVPRWAPRDGEPPARPAPELSSSLNSEAPVFVPMGSLPTSPVQADHDDSLLTDEQLATKGGEESDNEEVPEWADS